MRRPELAKLLCERSSRRQQLDKYECEICGYIYDPKLGDPDNNVPPGTPFANLPAGWTCPTCGASKEDFKKVA